MTEQNDPREGTANETESPKAPEQHAQHEHHGQGEQLEQHEPPYTITGFLMSPKFGAAGSGGLEYERLPEAHDEDER